MVHKITKQWFLVLLVLISGSVGAGSNFTIESVRKIIEIEPTSIEGLLKQLPDNIKRNQVLMFHSGSLQEASYLAPRTMVFSPNADFVLTFNGDSQAKGFHKLEIMQFDHSGYNFEFYELSEIGGRLEIGNKNPSQCLRCHGEDPRPNWEAYSDWPNAYGSQSDTAVKGTEEFIYISQFLDTFMDVPRYQLFPVIARNFKLNRGRNQYKEYYSLGSMNSHLTQRLGLLNIRRMVDRMMKTSDYDTFKYAIKAAIKNCDQFPRRFLRTEVLNQLEDFSTYREDQNKKVHLQELSYFPYDGRPEKRIVEITTKLRYIFESRGVDIRGWFMSYNQDAYGATLPNSFIPSLSRWLEYKDQDMGVVSCDRLAERSIEAQKNFKFSKHNPPSAINLIAEDSILDRLYHSNLSQDQKRRAHNTIQRCYSCHQAGAAPQFDFLSLTPKQLEEITWRTENKGIAQMPPTTLLSKEDREALLTFLKSI